MVYPLSVFRSESLDFEGYYYNPNIHPRDEFERRMHSLERLSQIKDFKTTYVDQIKQDIWEEFSGSSDERCRMCYTLRLEETSRFAAENGFDMYTTTLLVSPYQNHSLIKEIGENLARKHGIEFYYRDFRIGFRKGQTEAKELELYRQKFCGCMQSKNS